MARHYVKATYDPNWISVEHKLPAEEDTVIFYSTKYLSQYIGEFRQQEFVCHGTKYTLEEVTHWQPLLLPPENIY